MSERLRSHEGKFNWKAWLFTMLAVAMLATACSPAIAKESRVPGVKTAVAYIDGQYIWGEPLIYPDVLIDGNSKLCDTPEKIENVSMCGEMEFNNALLELSDEQTAWLREHTYIVSQEGVKTICGAISAGCSNIGGLVFSSEVTQEGKYLLMNVQIHEVTHLLTRDYGSDDQPIMIVDSDAESCVVLKNLEEAVVCRPSSSGETLTDCFGVHLGELVENSVATAMTSIYYENPCGELSMDYSAKCTAYNGYLFDEPVPRHNLEYLVPRGELSALITRVIINKDKVEDVIGALKRKDILGSWASYFALWGWDNNVTPAQVYRAGETALSLRTYTNVFADPNYTERFLYESEDESPITMCQMYAEDGN